MGGNVWELVSDYYNPVGYPTGPSIDPQGPATGQMRVARGGGFDYPAFFARSAARGYHDPQAKKQSSAVGFRVVCEQGR